MSNVIKLERPGSDADIAADLKKRMTEAYAPILALFDEATAAGLQMQCTSGLGTLGRHVIITLTVARPL